MSDVYRKVGRGGAGNFYSQNDVEEHMAQASSASGGDGDLEAQKPAPADDVPSDPAIEQHQQPAAATSTSAAGSSGDAPAYGVRTGRGGAGNFIDPLTASSSSEPTVRQHAQPRPPTVHTTGNQSFFLKQQQKEAENSAAPPRLSGRGGAGNWGGGPSEAERKTVDDEQERKRREAIDKGIFDDVRAGLQEPGRAHTRVQPHGRDAGMRGFEES
ncbi:hypothetical protein LQW54_002579 [Pestalotiopsis sp. IQ-011]